MLGQLWSMVLVMLMVLSIPLKFVFGAWYLIVMVLGNEENKTCN